jgi:misacylated tRNA(Ala) deacylase
MMEPSTHALFRDDPYLKEAAASVLAVNERGGVILDRTIFYATSGGQPGDTGYFERADGSRVEIAATVTGQTKDEISRPLLLVNRSGFPSTGPVATC